MNISKIKQALQKNKIPIKTIYLSEDDLEDSEISITDKIHIQVGEGYMFVCKEINDSCFEFSPERSRIYDIIRDVKKYLENK